MMIYFISYHGIIVRSYVLHTCTGIHMILFVRVSIDSIPLISPYFPRFCSSDCFWHNSYICLISFVAITVNTMS